MFRSGIKVLVKLDGCNVCVELPITGIRANINIRLETTLLIYMFATLSLARVYSLVGKEFYKVSIEQSPNRTLLELSTI